MVRWLREGPVGLARRAVGYRSMDVARVIQRNLRTIVTPTHPQDNGIGIPELGIVVDPFCNEDILIALPELLSLKRNKGAEFRMVENSVLEIRLDGVCVLTETIQDMLTVHEIFESRIYALEYDNPALVWDVGANVGIASLFFTTHKGWDVAAYEPFPATAEAARRNISRNALDGRIEFTAAGIGGRARSEQVLYHHDWRAGNGLFGNLHRGKLDEGTTVEIQILDAADELKRVHARANGRVVIAKIDCEGAEYEILRRLRDTDDIRKMGIVLLEVHDIPNENPEEPRSVLLETGFAIMRHERPAEGFQTIYAARCG